MSQNGETVEPLVIQTTANFTDYYHQLIQEGLYLASWWPGRRTSDAPVPVMVELRTATTPERAIRVQIHNPYFTNDSVDISGMIGQPISSIDDAYPKKAHGHEYFIAHAITFRSGSRIQSVPTHGNHLGRAPHKLETIPRIPLSDLVNGAGNKDVNTRLIGQTWIVIGINDVWLTLMLPTQASLDQNTHLLLVHQELLDLFDGATPQLNKPFETGAIVWAFRDGTVDVQVDSNVPHIGRVVAKR